MSLFDKERLAKLRQKQETAFVPIFLHRPLAILFLIPTADWKILTPNRLTTISVLMRFVVAWMMLPERFGGPAGSLSMSIWAVVLWHLGGTIDAMDGTLARYRGGGTALGRYYDKISDRVLALSLVIALALRPYDRTGEVLPLILGMIYVSLTGTTSTAKWIEIGIRGEMGTTAGGAKDKDERPAPERTPMQWLVYWLWSLRTVFVVTEMDLPLWGSIALLTGHETWVFYYLCAFIVPYSIGTMAIRARAIHKLDLQKQRERTAAAT